MESNNIDVWATQLKSAHNAVLVFSFAAYYKLCAQASYLKHKY